MIVDFLLYFLVDTGCRL